MTGSPGRFPAGRDAAESPDGNHPGARAPFIAFEGIEGSGKSTQIQRLSLHLAQIGRPHLVTREPGGTPLGDALREMLLGPAGTGIDGLTELYLLEAARRMHVSHVIRPALESGVAVICDRFGDSSVAYQGGGRGLGHALVEALNQQATGGLTPDVTFLLDLPVEIGLARVGRRGRAEDRMERETPGFHERVRRAYLDTAVRRGPAYVVIPASGEEAAIFGEILVHLRALLGGSRPPAGL